MSDNVLQSNTYNPSWSPDTLALYDIMNQGEPSQELLDEYREMVTSMPTANPYEGAMFNPRACEIDQIGTEIDSAELTLQNQLDQIRTTANPTVVQQWESSIPNIIADMENAKNIMREYRDHTDRLLANFPTISSIVQSEISRNVSAIQGSNPCASFADIMGSILQVGQDILAEIMAAIANVMDSLDGVLELIEDAVSKLMAAIAAAMEKMLEEIDLLAQSMIQDRKMNMAMLMQFNFADPCLSSLMSQLTTGATQSIMNQQGRL